MTTFECNHCKNTWSKGVTRDMKYVTSCKKCKHKQVYNLLEITSCRYLQVSDSNSVYSYNFKTRTKAYLTLIYAINRYNDDLQEDNFFACNEGQEFSQGQPLTYSQFEIVKTHILTEKELG